MSPLKTAKNDAKKVFRKLGTCSRTFFYLINRQFGHNNETGERAADPLAGGILQKGHQCGMLWGASLAVGAESYRINKNLDKAIGTTIISTQHLMESFKEHTNTHDCYDITNCNFASKLSFAKYMITGRFLNCFNLAEKWAPKAIIAATKGLDNHKMDTPQQCLSCASEVAKKMGATDEETVTVAGFAGGLGLSGNACGALSAAIWMNSMAWSKENPGKSTFSNPKAKNTLKKFTETIDSEFLCHNISGRYFASLNQHTEFIQNGGCEKLINALAES